MTNRPIPFTTDLTSGFWEASREHVLALQRCASCRRWFHPPVPICLQCRGSDLAFEATSGRGAIHSCTVVTADLDTRFDGVTPLPIVAVELDDQEGLVVVANIVASASSGRIGDRCEAVFEELTETITLPQFRLAERQDA